MKEKIKRYVENASSEDMVKAFVVMPFIIFLLALIAINILKS